MIGQQFNIIQWSTWATPKLDNGDIDHNALTGDDLLDFVNKFNGSEFNL
jgi:hypothetical protein